MAELKPELVWIEGRCYRINDPSADAGQFKEHDLYENDDNFQEVDERESDDEDLQVTQVSDSKYLTTIHVAQHYLGSIIGKQGATKSRIEYETKTSLKIPKRGDKGDVQITGASAASVKRARSKIKMIVISSRAKQRPTHFISIPLQSTEILNNFNQFKKSILEEFPADSGIEESIFIRAQKLHITIGVMSLMDEEERRLASNLLAQARDTIVVPLLVKSPPLRIRLKGLAYMNDDPSNIHVMYTMPREDNGPPGTLQRLCDDVYQYFYKAGWMQKAYERDDVKLHVTVIKTSYRQDKPTSSGDSRAGNYRARNKQSFDGTKILEKYADYDFGVAELNTMHLSLMHSTKENDGYYLSTSVVSCYE